MRLAIITAIYDNYDTLKPIVPQEGVEVDWVCVTDRAPKEANGWRIVVEPRPFMHPNIAAKRPKMLPWEYSDSFWSIWMDASFLPQSPHLAREVIAHAKPIAQWQHPWRDCIYDEAEASKVLTKYVGLPIDPQMEQYRRQGHPEHWGLWSTGFIARQHSPKVMALGEEWLRACQEWGFQDQLSEAVALRNLGLRPERLPGCHTGNDWVQYHGSARH